MKFTIYINGRFKDTKSIIEIDEKLKLSELADLICNRLYSYNDELSDVTQSYLFSNNFKNPLGSNPKNECYEKDLRDKNGAHKTKISDAFNTPNKKLVFVFDFGSPIEITVKRID